MRGAGHASPVGGASGTLRRIAPWLGGLGFLFVMCALGYGFRALVQAVQSGAPPATGTAAATAAASPGAVLPGTATAAVDGTPSLSPVAGEVTVTPFTSFPVPTWQPSTTPSDAELEALVARMSLEDKVAQMVMVGFSGQSVTASQELRTMVGAYHVGGVVLVEANAHDPEQVSRLTTEMQALATANGAGIPLFVAINHEGGIVVRITEGVTGFPGNMAVAAAGRPEYAYTSAALAAQELRAMGINMNLAPVLDVNDNPLNPVIGVRSFGASPTVAADYGRLAVRGSQEHGVIAVAKHFPGHGSVTVDSHGALPVLEASADELARRELVPFQAAVEEGVVGIMTAHIAVPALDESGRPATLSPQVLTGLLRQQMGYDGLIVTDSLGMGGVSAGRGQAQAAVEAVQAGADVLLSTAPMEAHVEIIQALASAVRGGEIPVERINQSVLRILRAKRDYGLFELPPTPDLAGVGSPDHQAAADEMARQAVTVLREGDGDIPLPESPARLLLISPSQLPSAEVDTLFAELLRARGYDVSELVFSLDSGESRDQVYAAAIAQAPEYDVVIFGEWELIKRDVNWNDHWQAELVAVLDQANSRLIVVGWHNPAALLRCPQGAAFLTAYGNTRAQVSAVVAVLVGEQSAVGRLPMALGEESR